LEFGLANESYKAFNQRPWENLASLEDFLKLKTYLDHLMVQHRDQREGQRERDPYFPEAVFVLFKRIIKTLQREDKLEISDRKVIKLYKLIRARAFLLHGGVVTKDDLVMLRYIPDRLQDFTPVREKVDALLKLEA
jgi:MoxR-like ATPase